MFQELSIFSIIKCPSRTESMEDAGRDITTKDRDNKGLSIHKQEAKIKCLKIKCLKNKMSKNKMSKNV